MAVYQKMPAVPEVKQDQGRVEVGVEESVSVCKYGIVSMI